MEHSALRLRLLFAFLALLMIAASGAREMHGQFGAPAQPYFSLSSDRTFKTGQQPVIHLYASNVSSLEFRVYRVKDALEFFKGLEDYHRFGEQASRPVRDLTLVERYHRLKQDLRFRIQNMFRAQYTKQSRSVIRDRMTKSAAPQPVKANLAKPNVQVYPEIPLLNPQQVVAVWSQPISTVRRWDSQAVPFDVPGKGVYLVEATNGSLRAYTITVVTDIALIAKAATGHVVTFAVDRTSGAPVAGTQVSMVLNGQVVGEGTTDSNGMFEKFLTSEQADAAMLIMARKGDDVAVVSEYGFSVSTDPDRNLLGYIYTERPIYRPTHTVYFKGVLRVPAGDRYLLPPKKNIDVEIQDPDGKPVYRKTLPVSPSGTFHGEISLPASASLGTYSIMANPGRGYLHGNFDVEEYKKPEYEVKVTPEKSRVLQGDNINALIEARYFFGEPVTDAKVTYVVHTSPYWYFPHDDEFDEFESGGEYDYGGDQVQEQTGQLDAEGKLHVSIPTTVAENARYTRDVRYRIEARVTDQANREIAGSGFVVATYASFNLNIESDRYVHDAGSTGKFLITAQDYDKRPIETDVQVELSRWHWRQEQGEPVAWSTSVRTSATGQVRVEIPFHDAGSFRVRVRARSPENRDVVGDYYAWVTGQSQSWYGGARERVQIIPDKTSYTPGETARVLIVTGVPDAYVLVTTEGRTLQSPRVVHATSPTFSVDVPIRAEAIPNFFVSATFLHDNELYQGSKSIKVPPAERQLSVEVQPSKAEFKPGDAATYSVTTKDYMGKPVSAEVSFGLVDEAIYAIRPDAAEDIMKFFYGTTYNRVNTMSSLSYFFSGAAGKRQMRLAELRPSSALGQLKPERLLQPKIRKAFPDTAVWMADLKTDNNGQAVVRLNFPDALTTWRATARAITDDTRVGSTVQKTIVRKNLILRLSVPRFFTQGDEVVVSVLVHNYLQNDKTARVSLEATGLQIIDGFTKDVMIPSRADVKVDWRVKAEKIGEVKLLGKALTDEESDAMELTLPVNPFGVKLATASAGSLAGTADFKTTVTFPKNIDPTSRSLEIGVSPSIAGAIFGGLDYLTSFPYGCTEQTMSSFLPNIVVMNALKQLNVKSNVDEAALNKKVKDGLARLYHYQHEDGGWGWWETDESMDFMTAYVVSGLAQARDAGVTVDTVRLDKASKWLAQQFDTSPRVVGDLRAYALYALSQSGNANAARIDSVWNQRGGLSPYGLALLGLVLDRTNDNRVQEVIMLMAGYAKADDREAYWPMMRDPLMGFEYDTSSESTAFAVKLLVKRQPESPLVPKAALWLVNHRSEGFYWSTTKQTAMVIYGLTDYLKASGELKPNFGVQVSVNGRLVLMKTFTAADALSTAPPVIRISAADLADDENRIQIVKNGTGLLYWNARGEYYSTDEKISRTGSIGLSLARDYFRLVPEKVNEKIVYRLTDLDGPVRAGDVLAVRLTVGGGNWNFLQIEDPIPAGTEFIERDDLYDLNQRPDWWSRWYTRREFHDDRASFFQTYYTPAQARYFYLLKVVNPGAFRTSPARVQPMYQPQYLATTESRALAVQQ